jgi:hypothetical protein
MVISIAFVYLGNRILLQIGTILMLPYVEKHVNKYYRVQRIFCGFGAEVWLGLAANTPKPNFSPETAFPSQIDWSEEYGFSDWPRKTIPPTSLQQYLSNNVMGSTTEYRGVSSNGVEPGECEGTPSPRNPCA